jgi:predicted Zn-dependent protease
MLGGQAMATGELYAFSRAQEQAADQAGMTFLDRLGWSGRGLQRLLGRMQEQELLTGGGRTLTSAPIPCRATGWTS